MNVPVMWDKSKSGNGFCFKNKYYGGWCLFPNQNLQTDGTAAETVRMTVADFDLMQNLWTSEGTADGDASTGDVGQGELWYTKMVTDKTLGVLDEEDKTDPKRERQDFSKFRCGAVDSPAADEQECFKYQIKNLPSAWSDGTPRFDTGGQGVTEVTAINGLAF